jgi:hypothetical protein
MTFQEADLKEKLLLVDNFKNVAKAMADLDDDCAAALKLITNRSWGTMTDAELADKGLTTARLNAYVVFITQFNRLMSNQSVTTTNGRAAVDGIRNVS